MASTLRKHHPDAELTVLLLDGDGQPVAAIERAHLVGLDEVIPGIAGLVAGANASAALAIAALPHLVGAVLGSGASSVLYIGTGQRLLAPLHDLLELMSMHDVSLVARIHAQERAVGAFRDEPSRGIFSREIMGFGGGPSSLALLGAWPRYFAIADDDGAGAVRRWLDGLPAVAEDVGVLRVPGYATDPWTLAEDAATRIAADAGEDLVIDGQPARLVDFAALDPEDPSAWLAGVEGTSLTANSAVRHLLEAHARDLLAAEWPTGLASSAPYAQLEDGLRLTDTIRTLLATAIAMGEVTHSPFTEQGRTELYEYLNEPGDRGLGARLTRLHVAIWRSREDLRTGYPHIDGPDGSGYAGWLCTYGVEQEGLVQELLPPIPDVAYRDADPHIHEEAPRWGVNIVGFLTAELGVGEAARLLIAGLDARGVPAMPIQGHLMPPSRRGVDYSYMAPDEAAYPINILCINGDGIPVFAREAGRSFFAGRYSIALWWWEAGEPPASWQAAYELVDEIWVASRHIYDAIAPSAPVPVVQIRLPLLVPEVADRSREQLGLPRDGFQFLCVYDYHSVAARKNPVAVIEAFRRAFQPGSGAKLVVKSINARTHPQEHARVLLAAGDHKDIVVLDHYAPSAEKNAMLAACDCYVSLHRSEGFGIPLAEAMMLGKPVIATSYGGSLEFMSDENSYLVNYKPVRVGEGAYPYAPDAMWAQPDVDHAASLMSSVFADPQQARERGERARRDMLERHSPAVAGEIMERRLLWVHRRLHEGGAHSLSLAHIPPLSRQEEMRDLIGRSPVLEVGHGRLRRLKSRAYRPVTSWARAHAEHQRKLDEAIQLNIERIDDRIREVAGTLQDQQKAQHAETLALLRRLEANLTKLRRTDSRD